MRQRRRMGLAVLVMALSVGLAVAAAPGAGQAQDAAEAVLEPAAVTLVNPSAGTVVAVVASVEADGRRTALRLQAVAAQDAVTFSLEAGTTPADYVLTCSGCTETAFSVASGQRALLLVGAGSGGSEGRGVLHLVNDGTVRRRGVVRTGAGPIGGRTVVSFDLAGGQVMDVPMRFAAGQRVDLHGECAGCAGVSARVSAGVELDVPVR